MDISSVFVTSFVTSFVGPGVSTVSFSVVVTSCVFVGPSIVLVKEIVSVDVMVLRIVSYEVRHSV